jgi:uncharacterized membrane protein HdeD (DUF308 family)
VDVPAGTMVAAAAASEREVGEMAEGQSRVITTRGEKVSPNFWRFMLLVGVVAVVFGVVVLANIWGSVKLVTVLAGLFLVFAGGLQFVHAAGAQRKLANLAGGAVVVVLGLALVVWPTSSVKTVAVLVGLAFVIWGVVAAVSAFVGRDEGWVTAAGFGGALALIGIIVMLWPGPTIAILMVLVGLSAIVFGASSIAQGLALRKQVRR